LFYWISFWISFHTHHKFLHTQSVDNASPWLSPTTISKPGDSFLEFSPCYYCFTMSYWQL
jgi:hypothetical protein